MFKRNVLTSLALTAIVAAVLSTDAMAQNQRSFVASDGLDTNACTLPFPCRSFGIAIGHTLAGGEVIVLDSAGYGPATITQAVSIVAPPGIYAGISVTALNPGAGLTVNAPGAKVTLRGLTITNVAAGTSGIVLQAGLALYVDGVTVSNFPTAGIAATVGATGSVHVANSIFRDNGTGGVFGTSTGTLTVSIESSLFGRNATGLSFRDGTVGTVHLSTVSGGTTGVVVAPPTSGKTANIEVRDSTISDNSGVGVTATQTGAVSPVNLVSVVTSQVSGNLAGIQVTGTNSSAYVSDSTIVRNATGVSAVSSGAIVSGDDNRLVANTVNGTFTLFVDKL